MEIRLKGQHTPNAIRQRARFIIFQKQINLSITKNFSRNEKQMGIAVEILQNLQ